MTTPITALCLTVAQLTIAHQAEPHHTGLSARTRTLPDTTMREPTVPLISQPDRRFRARTLPNPYIHYHTVAELTQHGLSLPEAEI